MFTMPSEKLEQAGQPQPELQALKRGCPESSNHSAAIILVRFSSSAEDSAGSHSNTLISLLTNPADPGECLEVHERPVSASWGQEPCLLVAST